MPDTYQSPPKTFARRLRWIGPGILFAATAIGSGELILTPRAGALFGMQLAWVIGLAIIYKLILTEGLARYTVATGEDIFHGFARLPGPGNWFVWFMNVVFLLGAVGYSGITLACGSALYGLFPNFSMFQWSILVVIMAYIFLLRGAYRPVELVAIGLAFVLLVGVFYNLGSLGLEVGGLVSGLVPRMPEDAGTTALSLLGWTAGGTSTLLYSFWLLEKGITVGGKGGRGRNNSADSSSEERAADARGWLKLARLDLGISYGMMVCVSFAFLSLGVMVLHTGGPDGGPLVPARDQTTIILSKLLTAAVGPSGKYLFLVAAFAALFSTVLGLVDGKSRALGAGLKIVLPKTGKLSNLVRYRVMVTAMCLIIFVFLFSARPVGLITLTALLEAPVLSVSAILLVYLIHTRVPKSLRPGITWHVILGVGTVAYFALSIRELIIRIG